MALPHPSTWSNYHTALFQQDFIGTSATRPFVTVILDGGPGRLQRYRCLRLRSARFPGRDVIFWFYLLTLMVPNIVTIIPLYTIMDKLHLLNTYWADFLPYVLGTPYTIFLMRQFFTAYPRRW